MSTSDGATLDTVLAALGSYIGSEERVEFDALRERVRSRRLRVLVAGEAKRGKSTLVNRLLGQDVLPTGVVPVTAITTTVRRVSAEPPPARRVQVTFVDGRREWLPLSGLDELVTERGNPANAKAVSQVHVLLGPGPLDQFDVELVDTPGTGSVFEHNSTVAHDAYRTADVAIVVVSADPPISAAERDVLREVHALSVHTLVFLNKTDQLDEGDLAEAVAFTRNVVEQTVGEPIPVQAGSARDGRVDAGYRAFEDTFLAYLASSGERDAARALAGHTWRLVTALLDAARLERRALELIADGQRDRVQAFADRVADLRREHGELEDRCWGFERGLRRGLDQAAGDLRGRLAARAREALLQALDGPLTAAAPAELDERGRAVVIATVTAVVDEWRAQQADVLETGLREAWQRTTDEHERHLRELRASARELLDLDLSVPVEHRRLAESRGFWYLFDRPVSFELPLAGTVRRIAPRRARRARAALLAEAPELVDRQVGRARADLQERLAEGTRQLVSDLGKVQEDIVRRLQDALASLTDERATTGPTQRSQLDGLEERIRALQGMLITMGVEGGEADEPAARPLGDSRVGG
ncbi:MAG: dynamin family protein [Motilibacteraceae bacterium]